MLQNRPLIMLFFLTGSALLLSVNTESLSFSSKTAINTNHSSKDFSSYKEHKPETELATASMTKTLFTAFNSPKTKTEPSSVSAESYTHSATATTSASTNKTSTAITTSTSNPSTATTVTSTTASILLITTSTSITNSRLFATTSRTAASEQESVPTSEILFSPTSDIDTKQFRQDELTRTTSKPKESEWYNDWRGAVFIPLCSAVLLVIVIFAGYRVMKKQNEIDDPHIEEPNSEIASATELGTPEQQEDSSKIEQTQGRKRSTRKDPENEISLMNTESLLDCLSDRRDEFMGRKAAVSIHETNKSPELDKYNNTDHMNQKPNSQQTEINKINSQHAEQADPGVESEIIRQITTELCETRSNYDTKHRYKGTSLRQLPTPIARTSIF